MTKPRVLVLGATGKTGRRVADLLHTAGVGVRTAARHDADVHFDWGDIATYDPAVADIDAVFLSMQTLRDGHAQEVSMFLDHAQTSGLQHVTLLSARGVDQAPAEVPARAVELDVAARNGLTHTVLRPNWFMQNFSEAFFQPSIASEGVILAPTGASTEAFIDAEDIAEVALATLLHPQKHNGAQYMLSGPEALSFAEVAQHIARASGLVVRHDDLPVEDWVAQNLAAGMEHDFAALHVMLFAAINAGAGSSLSDDVRRVTGHPARRFADYAEAAHVLGKWSRQRPPARPTEAPAGNPVAAD